MFPCRHCAAAVAIPWQAALLLQLAVAAGYGAEDNTKCSSLQALPLPGAHVERWETKGDDDVVLHYRCDKPFTVDGKEGGETALTLSCRSGRFDPGEAEQKGCAPVTPDEAHCSDASCLRGPSCELPGTWKIESLDVSDCSAGREDGQSCVVRCAKDFYQPSFGRFHEEKQLATADQVPIVLVCDRGTFRKLNSNLDGPPTCIKANVREFDVYALLREENGELLYPTGHPVEEIGLPSNIDVYDLESLLANLYTSVSAFQQELAKLDLLYRDRESSRFFLRHRSGEIVDFTPQLPLTRDTVNTVVWYRLQVHLPKPIKLATKYEFGTFASFQRGKATNEHVFDQFREYGGVVGLSQQLRGLIRMYEATDEGKNNGADSAKCNQPKYRKSHPTHCKAIFNPQSDPRYAPVGRFNSFSLPGRCPNRMFAEKNISADVPDGACLQQKDGSDFGGLCPGPPDGSASCTYSLQEVARIAMSDITGITSLSCGGANCKDLRDFQLNCDNKELRQGIKIGSKDDAGSGSTEERECVEYAVVEEECSWNCFDSCAEARENISSDKSVTKYNVGGQVVECALCEAGGETTVSFFQGRCDATKNSARLKKLQRMFLDAAAKSGSRPSPPEVIQDCGDLDGCKKPDTQLGLSYCERDNTGICSSCYISGTKKFNPDRAAGLTPCRTDLFTSGGYSGGTGKGKPKCGSQDGSSSCNKYLLQQREAEGEAARWKPLADWSRCSTTCGQGFRRRVVTCPNESEFGPCQREIGDPENSFCRDGTCSEIEDCDGRQCAWMSSCEGGKAALAKALEAGKRWFLGGADGDGPSTDPGCNTKTGGMCYFGECDSALGVTNCTWSRHCECAEGYCTNSDDVCVKAAEATTTTEAILETTTTQAAQAAGNCPLVDWGPPEGGCVASKRTLAKRCGFFAPGKDNNEFCPDLGEAKYEQPALLGRKSRLANCAVCHSESSTGCIKCSAEDGLFKAAEDGSTCVNTEPMLKMQLLLTLNGPDASNGLLAGSGHPFQQTSFWELSKLIRQEAAKTSTWASDKFKAYLVDVFRKEASSDPTKSSSKEEAEQWVFVVAVFLGKDGDRLGQAKIESLSAEGPKDLAVALAAAFQAEYAEYGEPSFEVLEDGSLVCTDMKTPPCSRGGFPGDLAFTLGIVLAIATVIIGGSLMWKRFARQGWKRAPPAGSRGRPQPGLELGSL